MHGYNYRDLMDKVGVAPNVFKSGRFKDMLSGEKKPEEISQEERALVQDMVDTTFLRFKEVIRDGRSWAASQDGEAVRSLFRAMSNTRMDAFSPESRPGNWAW